MLRLTPVWTDQHRRAALLLLALSIVVLSAAREPQVMLAIVIAAIVCASACVSLAFPAPLAGVIGLASAVAIVVLKRQVGAWNDATFAISAFETLGSVVLCVLAGAHGTALPVHVDTASSEPGSTRTGQDHFPALGLLPASLGELRIEEETERAKLFDRPLSIVRISLRLRKVMVTDAERQRLLFRAVCRRIESMVRLTDIPFAYDDSDLVVVLPETDADGAQRVVRRLHLVLKTAQIGIRPFGQRMRLGDYVEARFAVGSAPNASESGVLLCTTLGDLLATSRHPSEDDTVEFAIRVLATAPELTMEWFVLDAGAIVPTPIDGDRRRDAVMTGRGELPFSTPLRSPTTAALDTPGDIAPAAIVRTSSER